MLKSFVLSSAGGPRGGNRGALFCLCGGRMVGNAEPVVRKLHAGSRRAKRTEKPVATGHEGAKSKHGSGVRVKLTSTPTVKPLGDESDALRYMKLERKARRTPEKPPQNPTYNSDTITSIHMHRADFPSFEEALRERNALSAMRKFRDICADETARSELALHHFSSLLRCLVNNRVPPVDDMKDVMLSMKQLEIAPDLACYNAMVEAYARLSDIDGARGVLGDMSAAGFAPDMHTYNLFLRLYVRKGELDEALAFFNRMISEGIEPNVASYNTLIAGCADANRPDLAAHYFSEMRDLGFPPNVVTFNHLLLMHIRRGALDKAEEVFSQMGAMGVEPDLFCCTTLMSGFSKAGKVDKALELFTRMRERGLEADVTMYTTVIQMKLKAGDIKGAIASLGDLQAEGKSADGILYLALIDGAIKAGEFDAASELLRKFRQTQFKLPAPAYRSLIQSYAGAGRIKEATGLFDEMKREGVTPGTVIYNAIMRGAAIALDFKTVRKFWMELSAKPEPGEPEKYAQPNATSYAIILETNIVARDMNRAMDICAEMAKEGYEPETHVFLAMIAGNVESRKFGNAAKCIAWMRKSISSNKADVKNVVKENAAEFQDQIVKLFNQAKEAAGDDNPRDSWYIRKIAVGLYHELVAADVTPPAQVFASVMEFHRACRDLIGVVKVWTTLQKSHHEPSPESVLSLVTAARDLGQHRTAKAVHDMLRNNTSLTLSPKAWEVYLQMLARFGMDSEIRHGLLDMVNAGIPLKASMWTQVDRRLEDAQMFGAQKRLREFLEENFPEALEEELYGPEESEADDGAGEEDGKDEINDPASELERARKFEF
ncbi:hypothetical protein HK104_008850 [Borealophlyctis nickersoniae]|nr:hypothetical protein HK104_008850 [Borealophlyctis nickersoniae]